MNQRARATNGRPEGFTHAGRDRVPFTLSTFNYYFFVLFVTAAVLLIVWALLHDGYDDSPRIVAGISAVTVAVTLILYREVVQRRSYNRAIAARRLSQHLRLVTGGRRDTDIGNRLTLQRNEEILREIRTRSDAAKVLGKFADAHKDVLDLCEEYISAASAELSTVRPGSPRIPALRKGTRSASARHRFHMLKWAEIKARSFTNEAAHAGRLSEKIDAAEEALDAVETAVTAYPEESALIDSQKVLNTFLISARIKKAIESAERADERGNLKKAVDHYRAALRGLERSNIEFSDREAVYEKIESEIRRISKLADA